MVDVGEEKALVDGDVGGVLIEAGVSGALVRVPILPYMRLATLLFVVLRIRWIKLDNR